MWVVKDGWQPLPGIGPGPMTDDEFRERAATFAAANAFTVDEVVQNGPYERVTEAAATPAPPAEEE